MGGSTLKCGGAEIAVVASPADAVIVLDCQGLICEWNPAAESLFGHAKADVLGQDFFHLIAPRCGPRACTDAVCQRRLCSTAGRSLRLFAKRQSGEEIPIEMETVGGCAGAEDSSLLVVRNAAPREKACRPSPLTAALPEEA
jgi:two-component system sensor kinase FixL